VAAIRRAGAGALALLLVCAAAAPGAIPRPGAFAGPTSQAYPDGSRGTVKIEMTRGGRRIARFDITWLAACDNGFTNLSQGTRAEGWLSSRGRFHGGGRYLSDGGNLEGTPYTATVRNRLRGRFVSRTRAKGTFQATAVLHDAAGLAVSTCASPPIAWSATHR
jgi:hypothetical protein